MGDGIRRVQFIIEPEIHACNYYRAILPYRFLRGPLAERGIDLKVMRDVGGNDNVDAAIISRIVSPAGLARLIARRSRGMRFAYESDDDLLHLPDWNPLKGELLESERETMLAAMIAADALWASTRPLAERFASIPGRRSERHPMTLPNLLDLDLWSGGRDHPEPGDRLRLLYSGSDTHDGDVAVIEKALAAVLRKHKHVDLVYYGDPPPAWHANWFGRLHHVHWTPLADYPKTLQSIRPEIALCPLADHPFNFSKSSIKYAEYTLAGAAVVATPLPPYFIPDRSAIAYANSTEEWFAQIDRLVLDAELRQAQHAKALQYVRQDLTWQHSPMSKAWLGAVEALLRGR